MVIYDPLTQDRAWFLLDKTNGDYDAVIGRLVIRHAELWPNNVLSVVDNDLNTQSLAKVEGADDAWREDPIIAALLSSDVILDSYTILDHDRAVTLLATDPNWTNTRSESMVSPRMGVPEGFWARTVSFSNRWMGKIKGFFKKREG